MRKRAHITRASAIRTRRHGVTRRRGPADSRAGPVAGRSAATAAFAGYGIGQPGKGKRLLLDSLGERGGQPTRTGGGRYGFASGAGRTGAAGSSDWPLM